MSELPGNWTYTTIGDVTVTKVKQHKPLPNEHFYYIDISSIDRVTKKILNPQKISGESAPSRARQVVASGDVLVSMTRPNLNAVAMVPDQLDGQIASTGFDVLRPIEFDSRWLYYLVRTDSFVTTMSNLVQGALYPAVRPKDIHGYMFPLAPLPEQKRIADKLDSLLARVDSCQSHLERIPEILKRFRQSVLAAATSGRLTERWREENSIRNSGKDIVDEIRSAHEAVGGHKAGNAAAPTEGVHDLIPEMFPDSWEIADLRDLVRPDRPITYGILKPGPDLENGIPYIRVADYPGDKLSFDDIRRTSQEMDKQFSRSKLEPGDILLSIRGTVGRLIVIPPELEGANITQDSARLSIQSCVNRDYVLWYLRSEIAQSRMRKAIKGVAVRGINIGDVRALQIPIPSLEEQHEIVRRVERLFAFAERLEARWQAGGDLVEQLIPSLLAKAFRGELVEQDPEDEPASVLLERIKAARAAQPKKSKRAPMRKKPKEIKMTPDTVIGTIRKFPKDIFSFEELRKKIPGDYEQLKTIIFNLLSEENPVIRQEFDEFAETMRFVRRLR